MALQVGLGDILTGVFSNQLELELILLSIAGYTFLSMTARKTWLWRQTSASERYLIGITMGLGFEGLLVFPYAGYLLLMRQSLDILAAFNYTSIWSIVFLVGMSLVVRSGGTTESMYRRTVSAFSKIVGYFVAFVFFVVLALTLCVSFFYVPETRPLLVPFLLGSWVFWYIATVYSFGFWMIYHNIFHKRLPSYAELGTRDLGPRLQKFSRWIHGFDDSSALKRGAVVITLASIVAVAGVALDFNLGVVTPRVGSRTTNYTSTYPPFPPVGTYLEIVGEGTPVVINGTKGCTVNVYQTLEKWVTIRTPLLKSNSLQNISIPNPSTLSVNVAQYAPVQPGEVWTYLGVQNPNHTAITAVPKSGPVVSLDVGLPNQSAWSRVSIGLIYYKLSSGSQVTCTANLNYSKLPNGTAIATEKFTLRNNGNSTALVNIIHIRDLQDLISGNLLFANPRLVTLYWNNNPNPFNSVGGDEMALIVGAIPPGNETTFTVSAIGPGAF